MANVSRQVSLIKDTKYTVKNPPKESTPKKTKSRKPKPPVKKKPAEKNILPWM